MVAKVLFVSDRMISRFGFAVFYRFARREASEEDKVLGRQQTVSDLGLNRTRD
jgi:hypothetical protein